MAAPKVTIKDVAKRAGVSIATVSRYVNNLPCLRENNRKKIEKAIKELDYRPLIYARRLAGGKLNTFGLIIPGYEGIFYSFYALEIIRQVAASLDEKNIDLHLNIYREKDNFNSSLVDGVIIADLISNRSQMLRLAKEELPLVVLNYQVSEPEISFVAVDNVRGGFEATDFLASHGHKRIAHLAGNPDVQCAAQRLEGFKKALRKNKIKENDKYICFTDFSRIQARKNLETLFSLKEVPTAIFCCSDEVASEVINFADENSIKIPEKLSLVGFDDNPNCIGGNLMLTTVRQPLAQMAKEAVSILEKQTKSKNPALQTLLKPELVIRDTVGFA